MFEVWTEQNQKYCPHRDRCKCPYPSFYSLLTLKHLWIHYYCDRNHCYIRTFQMIFLFRINSIKTLLMSNLLDAKWINLARIQCKWLTLCKPIPLIECMVLCGLIINMNKNEIRLKICNQGRSKCIWIIYFWTFCFHF